MLLVFVFIMCDMAVVTLQFPTGIMNVCVWEPLQTDVLCLSHLLCGECLLLRVYQQHLLSQSIVFPLQSERPGVCSVMRLCAADVLYVVWIWDQSEI